MEFIALVMIVILYQWLFLPLLKKKVGYVRVEGTLWYRYKTKWQLPFELAVIAVVSVSIILLTPLLDLWSAAFVPIGFVVILVVRGIVEKKYEADMNHHIISFVQALAVLGIFLGIGFYRLFMA